MSFSSDIRKNIEQIVSACSLPASEMQVVSNTILNLSPKKIGLFLEMFCRHANAFLPSPTNNYDAVSNAQSVEIKCSRVIHESNKDSDNLFDELLGGSRKLLSFNDAFFYSFDCNIQQVKPDHFDRLYYYLIFSDCILAFQANKDLFSIPAQEIYANTLEQLASAHLINSQELNSLSALPSKVGLSLLQERFPQSLCVKDSFLALQKLSNLKYSDKQHRGNSGEGQFHINHKNLGFHLAENFVKAYNYADFKEILQKIIRNPPENRAPLKKSNQIK